MGVSKALDGLAALRERVCDRKTDRMAMNLKQTLRHEAGGKSADEDAASPIAM
jgi:hypothetical protein